MSSISDTNFMMKFNFYNDKIPQYSEVRIITIINNSCLIEDIHTKNRIWVMKYDIYPLSNYDNNGFWEYNSYYDEIAENYNLK